MKVESMRNYTSTASELEGRRNGSGAGSINMLHTSPVSNPAYTKTNKTTPRVKGHCRTTLGKMATILNRRTPSA